MALHDELLEEIFFRLTSAADLGRASMVCTTFRRVITNHSFLRRFRTLHPPPLLGIICDTFLPAQSPHPSAAPARAFADVDFQCSFLPSTERWRSRDFRDGRALFSAAPVGSSYASFHYSRCEFVRDFAVCDPLYRRYVLLPSIPHKLASLVYLSYILKFEPFLAPPEDDEDITSFRVMCLVQCTTRLVLFVFSSVAAKWHVVAFEGWIASMKGSDNRVSLFELTWASARYYANKCFYWAVYPSNKLLMLDTHMMEFSSVNLGPPIGPGQMSPMMAFVETGEGKLGMFTLVEHPSYFLRYSQLQNDEHGAKQWKVVSVISLPLNYRYIIMDVVGGYLLLQGIPEDLHSTTFSERPDLDCFSLNLQTLQLEWFCAIKHMVVRSPLYAGFPPSLSLPTV